MKITIGKKQIGSEKPVYIIAEIGVNHCGNINLAKKMILAAKINGADAVKFQTFLAESIATPKTPKVRYQIKSTSKKESHYEMLRSLELSKKNHEILFKFCKRKKIQFLSTPYDINSAKFLNKLGCKAFKTSSADIVDLQLHSYLAKTKKPVIISTGMANYEEIKKCLQIYKKHSNKKIILLHCVSNYPCSNKSLNMSVLTELKSRFKCMVGFSDHSVGSDAAAISVALGGVLIEKHFTLNKNLTGPDHKASSSPSEFKKLVGIVRKTQIILGTKKKICQPEELQMSKISRKSLTLNFDLEKGSKLKKRDVVLKRPGTGIFYQDLNKLIGKKAKKKLFTNHQIKISDFI